MKDYSNEPSFTAAFSLALKELGEGKSFTYKGKVYKVELEEKKSQTLYDIVIPFLGQKEVNGPSSNPWILKIIKKFFPSWTDDSTISWCSMLLKYLFEIEGYNVTKATPAARSWLNVGTPLSLPEYKNCIVVLKRGTQEWQGHVGIPVRDLGTHVEVLGGNQSNSISIQKFSKSDVLGYRKLIKI